MCCFNDFVNIMYELIITAVGFCAKASLVHKGNGIMQLHVIRDDIGVIGQALLTAPCSS